MGGGSWLPVIYWGRYFLAMGKRNPVPNNQDTFIAVLRWISGINAIAAMCAALAFICAAYYVFFKSGWS